MFQESIPSLWDPNVLSQYYNLPDPINQTTPLDLLIGLGQLYATISMCLSGWTMFHTNYGKYIRIQRILLDIKYLRHRPSAVVTSSSSSSTTMTDADRLVHESLLQQAKYALRFMLVGFLLFCIGSSFFILFTNSIHITETGWNGGIQGVIHAVTVMEIGLFPLLIFMWQDGYDQLDKAKRMMKLVKQLLLLLQQKQQDQSEQQQKQKQQDPVIKKVMESSKVDLFLFQAVSDWNPFWNSGLGLLEMTTVPDSKMEEELVTQEIVNVQKALDAYFANNNNNNKDEKKKANNNNNKDEKKKTNNNNNNDDMKKKNDDNKEKDDTTLLFKVYQEKIQELMFKSRIMKWEGYRELLFFVLNVIAFYSYLVCVIVFYYKDETIKPYVVQSMLFGLNDDDADWHGNFWGDLMWTIEPIVLLSTTRIFATMNTSFAISTTMTVSSSITDPQSKDKAE